MVAAFDGESRAEVRLPVIVIYIGMYWMSQVVLIRIMYVHSSSTIMSRTRQDSNKKTKMWIRK